MRLDDMRQSDNFEDRRNETYKVERSRASVLFLARIVSPLFKTRYGWVIMLLLAVFYYTGIDPLAFLKKEEAPAAKISPKEEAKRVEFVKKVLATTEDVWEKLWLEKRGRHYPAPKLVLYRGIVKSGCGFAGSGGPFYCSEDRKLYLDLEFFDELAQRFQAPGDFAQAYVIAHEVGHHIQNLEGTLERVHARRKEAAKRGDRVAVRRLQIPAELQADCYAGVWGHYMIERLDPGDLEEALNAAAQIGDDAIQKRVRGSVEPDTFTHGTSAQRKKWFAIGYRSGDPESCDTFAALSAS